MNVKQYRKKPIVVEAVQLTLTNASDVADWCHGVYVPICKGWSPFGDINHCEVQVHTLEGTMTAMPGWWIIKGFRGEFYPCEPGIFSASYEESNE